jgi:pyrroline-5-carboxylate reductase
MGGKFEMKDLSAGFIGGGRITQLFLEAWKNQGNLPAKIWVSDNNAEVLESLKKKYPSIETALADNGKPSSCDLVFLALHPPAIAAVLDEIRGKLKPSAFLISLAPKVSIDKMISALSGFARIVRMIPNAPSVIHEGYNPVCFSPALNENERSSLLHLFKIWGESPEVDEEKLEAYAILSAMGPTYFWFQLQQLRTLGGSFGLTQKETDQALYEMIKGAAKTLFKSGLAYDEVVNLIPVKPLGEEEQGIRQIYETRLTGLYSKLKS